MSNILTIIFGLWVAILVGLGMTGVIPISYIAEAKATSNRTWTAPDMHYYAQFSVFCAYKNKAISCLYVPRDTIRGDGHE